MKEVKLVIEGKEYAKTQPMLQDWLARLEYQRDFEGKEVAAGPETAMAVVESVAQYLGAPADKLGACCPLNDIFEAFRDIDRNLSEAILGGHPKNAEGAKAPKK